MNPYTNLKNLNFNLNFGNYRTRGLIFIIGTLWAAAWWLLSCLWGYGLFQGIGTTFLVFLFLVIYDNFLWKYPFFDLFVKIPNLEGMYEGKIYFSLGEETVQSKNCSLEIRQTASTIRVIAVFGEGVSSTTRSTHSEAMIVPDGCGGHKLLNFYQNSGNQQNEDGLAQHDGCSDLQIKQNGRETVLDGKYFTNRKPPTRGSLIVTRRNTL